MTFPTGDKSADASSSMASRVSAAGDGYDGGGGGGSVGKWKTKALLLLNRLLRTKDPADTNSPDGVTTRTTLTKCLDTLDLTSLGVGSCVGTGMYLVAGMVARKIAGPGVILSFIIAAVASIFSGACYAEFGVRVPHTTGSAYMYSYVTVGEFVAFVIGWNMVLEYLIGTSACACALSACFNILTDGAVESAGAAMFGRGLFGSPPDVLAFFITVLMTGLLVTGAKKSLLFTNVMNLINFAVWAFIIGASVFYVDVSNWTRHGGFLPYGWSGVLTGAATCFYAFIGFDIIATTGEEALNPKKSIPKAIVGSLLIALVAYVSSSLVLTLMLPFSEIDENSGLLEAFGHVGAPRCRSIVGIGALAGLTVAMFGSMFPMPRVVYAMAKDGLIFRMLASVWDRTNTPAFATVVFGMAAAFAALLISLEVLVEMMSIGTLLAYTLVSTCVLILRYQPKSTTLVELIPESIRTPAMLTPAASPRGSTGDICLTRSLQGRASHQVVGGLLSPSSDHLAAMAAGGGHNSVSGHSAAPLQTSSPHSSDASTTAGFGSRLTSALQNASFPTMPSMSSMSIPAMKLSIPTNPFLGGGGGGGGGNFQHQPQGTQQATSPSTANLEVGLSGNVVVTKKVTKGSMFAQCSFDSDTTVGTVEDREEPTDTDTSAESSWPPIAGRSSTNPFLSSAAAAGAAPNHDGGGSPSATNPFVSGGVAGRRSRSPQQQTAAAAAAAGTTTASFLTAANSGSYSSRVAASGMISASNSDDQLDSRNMSSRKEMTKNDMLQGADSITGVAADDRRGCPPPTSPRRRRWYPPAFEYIFPQIFPWHIRGPATEETGQMVMRGVGLFLLFIVLSNATLVVGIDRIEQGSAAVTLLLFVFLGASVVSVLFIARHPQNRRALPFLAPGLPYVPAIAITVNIYLILKLSVLTLVRFVIWMTIGLLIYFLYGIKNSSAEADWTNEQIELKIKDVDPGDLTPASSVAAEEKVASYYLRPENRMN